MRYRFTGPSRTVFPSIVVPTLDGFATLVVDPGDEVDLPDAVDHAELEAIEATNSRRKPAPTPDPEV